MPLMTIPDPNTLANSVSPGAQSAADKAKQDGQANGGWFGATENALSAIVPSLTDFVPVKLVMGSLTPTTNVVDAALEGVGIAPHTGSGDVWSRLPDHMFYAPKTRPWAVGVEMKISPTQTGKYCYFGLVDDTGDAGSIALGTAYNRDTTKIVAYAYDGVSDTGLVSSVVADSAAFHTYYLTFYLTTWAAWVDGVRVASSTVLTRLKDFTASVGFWDTQGGCVATRLVYGYKRLP